MGPGIAWQDARAGRGAARLGGSLFCCGRTDDAARQRCARPCPEATRQLQLAVLARADPASTAKGKRETETETETEAEAEIEIETEIEIEAETETETETATETETETDRQNV